MTATALALQASSAVTAVRERTVSQSLALWEALPDYSDAGLEMWLSQITPLVTGAERTIGNLTSVYLSQVLSQELGKTVSPAIAPAEMVTGAALRNGTTLVDEYTRPFLEIWSQLAEDVEFARAVGIGKSRMLNLVNTDVQLARTHAARHSMSQAKGLGVVGYRRVTSDTACKLCTVAATQRYHVENLMPIHNNCHCGIAPITGRSDPGQVIDRAHAKAETAYEGHNKNAVRKYAAAALEFPGVVVHEHGEIGPVLAVEGQTFTGPADISATETAAS